MIVLIYMKNTFFFNFIYFYYIYSIILYFIKIFIIFMSVFLVFEPYLLYILPRNVLPLLGFMVLLSVGIVKIVLPMVHGHLRQIKQE